MEDEMIAIGIDEPFRFACHSGVPCFNECCRDLNQFLTPYDILRLKKALGLSSTEFLEQYTLQHTGPESGLPVITLKPKESKRLTCPFVSPEGCRVYADRPGSCRMYPLARLASRSRETGNITEHYALLKEPHCRGWEEDKSQTVREWLESQGLPEYNRMNDRMMEIISLKNQASKGPLDLTQRHLFHMACYDVDRFRETAFEQGLLENLSLDRTEIDRLRHDDFHLLDAALSWIAKELFS